MTQTHATTPAHGHDDHGDHGHAHVPNLAHHFDTMEQQVNSGKLGMWVFLATEILMFGGLFCAYSVWRALHHDAFEIGHLYLNKWWGAFNTLLLISSSFTMAWAVRTAQLNKRTPTVILLALTFMGGVGFMCVKYVEYHHKFEIGVGPGIFYTAPKILKEEEDKAAAEAKKMREEADKAHPPAAPVAGPAFKTAIADAAPAPVGLADPMPATRPHGHHEADGDASAGEHSEYMHNSAEMVIARPFFSIYFVMTGLHGLHVLIGMALIAWIMIRANRGDFSSQYNAPVDLVGLYWHLVDLIWIFLFPLLYLIK
jgi:cytochrome c oxidase subunit 3